MKTCLLTALIWGTSVLANVFGPDARASLSSAPENFRSIGVVLKREANGKVKEQCTGTLMAERLVLTALHCLGDHATFTLTLNGVKYQAHIIHARGGEWRTEKDSRRGDWALVTLDRTLPFRGKYLRAGGPPRQGETISAIGYPIDIDDGRSLSAHFACKIRAVLKDGVFHHDCHTYAGSSGGPLLRRRGETWEIVGIHNAHKSRGTLGLTIPKYQPEYANLGAGADVFNSELAILAK